MLKKKVLFKKGKFSKLLNQMLESSWAERWEFTRQAGVFQPSHRPENSCKIAIGRGIFSIYPTGSAAEWGLFCYLSLNLCPVSLFRRSTSQSSLSDFIIPGALNGRKGKEGDLTTGEGSRLVAKLAANNHSVFGPGQRHRCQRHLTFCLPLFMKKNVLLDFLL